MRKSHTLAMNLIIVLLLCLAVQSSIGQPLASHSGKSSEVAEQLTSLDKQGMELINEINNLMLNHYSNEISSLMTVESSLIPTVAKLFQQRPEEESPESGPRKSNSEEIQSVSASCEGAQCGISLLHADNAIETQGLLMSPSSTSNGISISDIIELFHKITSVSTLPKLLQAELKKDLGTSTKEYLRKIDESALALKYKIVDMLEAFSNILRKPLLQISK